MGFLWHFSVQNCPFKNLAAQKNSLLEGLTHPISDISYFLLCESISDTIWKQLF